MIIKLFLYGLCVDEVEVPNGSLAMAELFAQTLKEKYVLDGEKYEIYGYVKSKANTGPLDAGAYTVAEGAR